MNYNTFYPICVSFLKSEVIHANDLMEFSLKSVHLGHTFKKLTGIVSASF
ncbi:hypothetical protein GKD07_05870 [Lactobacillus rhamnosus]|nr:hypothetical protein [Lacticaseibacillus rhamnosus]MSB97636.1 hypothetical protein [Lacticaseibacillus rhamnosus]MSC00668.1 hypothetical protein [Lacticaseibacillus rhamnosus]MSC06787.1 hypothetical protein [Lacticaseibacillus rhamnosus]MSC10996.1 hypothetical protein [Lacticaseibacillus rhamnosus]